MKQIPTTRRAFALTSINPFFYTLRFGYRLFQRPSPQKQFPSMKYQSIKLPLVAALIAVLTLASAVAQENPGLPWPATDALGRCLPLASEVGLTRTNRFVGIFYFQWLVPAMPIPPSRKGDGPLDVSKILASDPLAMQKPDSPLWGKVGQYHFWGEPLFGYYRSDDPWVLRRHAQMLADAGVDVLIMDATNAETYREVYTALCNVFRDVRQSGGHTPQIAFMLNTKAGDTAQRLYRELYQKNLYSELWFQWEGKPLLICDPKEVSEELKKFFTLRRAHWPFTMENTPYAWHWEATYPQPYGFTENPQKPEQVNVSVAQNLSAKDGSVSPMGSGQARGRSFHDGKQAIKAGSVNHGFNFQEQWGRALQLQSPFVMVTGWNEWIAGRWGKPDEQPVFVDQYDVEFSRDIEPVRGSHGDNYYWQLIAHVRRYKGAPALPITSAPKSISLASGFEQWRDVQPEFRDHLGETQPRQFDGVGGTRYTNTSGRNDFAVLKVARDAAKLYFHAQTVQPITASTGSNWMWLFINADQNAATGWAGYEFIVNRVADADGKFWLEKNLGGWQWEKVAPVELRVQGRELHMAIPRAAFGLTALGSKVDFDFKWADNLQQPGDVLDFYLSGDVAPEGRFNYRYHGD